MNKTLIVYSGGMDSTVLLYYLRSEGHTLHALSINYNQRHKKELDCAQAITSHLGITHDVVDLSSAGALFGKGSSQGDASVAVPEGHYTSENMRLTVVPNRNMILLAVAGGIAIANGCEAVAYGAHAGDHAVYPDCREEFAAAMNTAFSLCHEPGLALLRPFVHKTKAEIAALGAALGVPFEKTWSCYQGEDLHCGRCGTCTERLLAFKEAAIVDPTTYQDPVFALQWYSTNDHRGASCGA
jgi:7-cyano-7-deazaguanine synthase